MTKVAINGFGRIGRLFFRQAFGAKGIDIVCINDLGDIDNLAYLLRRDSVYGPYDKDVSVKNGNFVVGGKEVKVTQEKDLSRLPWKELGVDIVVEATGAFESYKDASAHIASGARRVVITAPAKDEDGGGGTTVLVGINDEDLGSTEITSNASCTTNAASPVISILNENPGIEKAILSTVHAYTATQNIVDGPTRGKDFLRGRAAAHNIVPSSTGAASAVTRVIKDLEGKFDGIALRVPVVAGSIADITFVSKRDTSVEEINDILRKAAKSAKWKGIFMASDEPLVSSDIVGQSYGAIADLTFTRVIDKNLVKVLSWYDNEWGYASTLLKHVLGVASSKK